MKILGKYMNGNTLVTLYEDGTKTMFTKDDEFDLDFPTNMDVKITNYCPVGCLFCHENSNKEGKHASLKRFSFIKTLTPGTEVALGGGALTTHPKLKTILKMFKEQGVIANITVHITEVLRNSDMLVEFQKEGLIHGIGVSMPSHMPSEEEEEALSKLDNVVFHVINGIYDIGFFSALSKTVKKPKLLILGYKHFRRGNDLYEKEKYFIDKRQQAMKDNIEEIANLFEVVSFDNLALEQLDIKNKVSQEEWEHCYQGDEGSLTMFIDAVEGKFAKNSISKRRYKMTNDVKEMFKRVREEK